MAERPIYGGIDLGFTVDDERLLIPLSINTADGVINHNLYFNPADYHIYKHIHALENVPEFNYSEDTTTDEFLNSMLELEIYVDTNFDEIFGKGTAKEVFRYSGFKHKIISGLMKQVRKGVEWFSSESENERRKEEAESRKEAISQAKAETKKFLEKK